MEAKWKGRDACVLHIWSMRLPSSSSLSFWDNQCLTMRLVHLLMLPNILVSSFSCVWGLLWSDLLCFALFVLHYGLLLLISLFILYSFFRHPVCGIHRAIFPSEICTSHNIHLRQFCTGESANNNDLCIPHWQLEQNLFWMAPAVAFHWNQLVIDIICWSVGCRWGAFWVDYYVYCTLSSLPFVLVV